MKFLSKYRKEVLLTLGLMGAISAVAHLAMGTSQTATRIVAVVVSVVLALILYYASYGIVAYQVRIHHGMRPFIKYFTIAAFYLFVTHTFVALASALHHIGEQPPFFLISAGFAVGMLDIHARHIGRREPPNELGS